MIRAAALAAGLIASPLAAQEIVANLSQERISIDATFDGSEILIFGAVRAGTAIDEPLHVVVTVSGPSEPVTVRRKARVAGIWVNRDSVEIDRAPSFYAVATSAPFFQAISHTENLRYAVAVPEAIRSVGATETVADAGAFTEALIRVRENQGYYQMLPETVTFLQNTLFNTEIRLPADLVEGDYTVRIFLTRVGQVVARFETSIPVSKVGLERIIYALAHERPLVYGLLSLSIAIVAGWLASAVFRWIRS